MSHYQHQILEPALSKFYNLHPFSGGTECPLKFLLTYHRADFHRYHKCSDKIFPLGILQRSGMKLNILVFLNVILKQISSRKCGKNWKIRFHSSDHRNRRSLYLSTSECSFRSPSCENRRGTTVNPAVQLLKGLLCAR